MLGSLRRAQCGRRSLCAGSWCFWTSWASASTSPLARRPVQDTDLVYVSPKSGRAVSAEAGEPTRTGCWRCQPFCAARARRCRDGRGRAGRLRAHRAFSGGARPAPPRYADARRARAACCLIFGRIPRSYCPQPCERGRHASHHAQHLFAPAARRRPWARSASVSGVLSALGQPFSSSRCSRSPCCFFWIRGAFLSDCSMASPWDWHGGMGAQAMGRARRARHHHVRLERRHPHRDPAASYRTTIRHLVAASCWRAPFGAGLTHLGARCSRPTFADRCSALPSPAWSAPLAGLLSAHRRYVDERLLFFVWQPAWRSASVRAAAPKPEHLIHLLPLLPLDIDRRWVTRSARTTNVSPLHGSCGAACSPVSRT